MTPDFRAVRRFRFWRQDAKAQRECPWYERDHWGFEKEIVKASEILVVAYTHLGRQHAAKRVRSTVDWAVREIL
jgi:hypothetical protein